MATPLKRLPLRAKIFLLFAGTSLLIVVPTLLLIASVVERQAYDRARSDLGAAAGALRGKWDDRDRELGQIALRLASDNSIEEALGTGDLEALRRQLQREGARGKGPRGRRPVIVAADTAGRILVAIGLDARARRALLAPPLDARTAAADPVSATVVSAAGNDQPPLRLAFLPVVSHDTAIVGVVGVGERLDSAALAGLRVGASGTDIALAVGGRLAASTLEKGELPPEALGVSDLLRRCSGQPQQLPLLPFLCRAEPLPSGGTATSALLFQPIGEELAIKNGILTSLGVIGVAALALAVLLAGIIARIVARPTQVLARAATQLARGDFRAPLPPASADEIGQLARAFADMRSAIAEREGRLRSAQAELVHREKLAAMGRLVAQLSHEINNPIYNIQNLLEALARRGDPRDPNREFLELAQEELARMAALTRRMLDQSRPLSEAATPLNLNALLRRVLALSSERMAQRGVTVEARLDPGLPLVTAHPDAMQQVLANLVENAGDAMAEGGTLRVDSCYNDDAVEVVVEDTGTGIVDEHLPHIFDAFFTTKPDIRGIGLGLFVSDGIVRGHRGRLSVESKPGQGTRFTMRLPRRTLDDTVAAPDAAPDAAPEAVAEAVLAPAGVAASGAEPTEPAAF